MGFMAPPELNLEMRAHGERFFRAVEESYRRHDCEFIAGREEAAKVDGAVQSLFAHFIESGGDPVTAIEALAHVTAMVLFQQPDLSAAKAEFARLVNEFGREFSEDSAAGRA